MMVSEAANLADMILLVRYCRFGGIIMRKKVNFRRGKKEFFGKIKSQKLTTEKREVVRVRRDSLSSVFGVPWLEAR